jgi:hypothetical protein
MRNVFLAAALAGAILPCTVHAGDRAEAVEILDKAIKAHGGVDALNRAINFSRTASGVVVNGDRETPFTDESIMALPDRGRMIVDLEKRYRIVTVVNGAKAWLSAGGGPAEEIGKDRVDELSEELYVLYVGTLTPLLKDGYTLQSLAESRVEERPALGIKVSCKGRPDVGLYFDKETNLLVKIDRKAKQAGIAVDKAYLFTAHKDFDGVKLPTRQMEVISGKRAVELKSVAYKILSRVDDASFAKP